MRLRQLLEVYRQPVVLFHGTSSSFLRSILGQGILPTPDQRVWDKDDNTSSATMSRKSLDGSYWTSNLLTASAAAWNSIKKFPGNRLFVCAQINEQSAFADEDSLNSKISGAYADTAKQLFPGIVTDAVGLHLGWFIYEPAKHEQAKALFATLLHQKLQPSPGNPIDTARLAQIFDDYLMRLFVHEYSDKHSLLGWASTNNVEQIPEFPSIQQAEHQFLMDRDWLTKRYRASAYQANDTFNHTLRVPTPVGFRGHNRIVCILEEAIDEQRNRSLILHYGQVPPAFIQAWEKSMGPWTDPPARVTEVRKLPGPRVAGSGKDFRQNPGVNRSPKQPGRLAGSGKAMKVKPGFVG